MWSRELGPETFIPYVRHVDETTIARLARLLHEAIDDAEELSADDVDALRFYLQAITTKLNRNTP